MRIDGQNRPDAAALAAGKSAGKSDAAQKSDKAETGKNAVVVSIGTAASRVSGPSARLPEEIASRLETVRQQLEDGNYEIDFARLAHRMADEEIARSGS